MIAGESADKGNVEAFRAGAVRGDSGRDLAGEDGNGDNSGVGFGEYVGVRGCRVNECVKVLDLLDGFG